MQELWGHSLHRSDPLALISLTTMILFFFFFFHIWPWQSRHWSLLPSSSQKSLRVPGFCTWLLLLFFSFFAWIYCFNFFFSFFTQFEIGLSCRPMLFSFNRNLPWTWSDFVEELTPFLFVCLMLDAPQWWCFFLACEDFRRLSNHLFPACTFFFFQWRLAHARWFDSLG